MKAGDNIKQLMFLESEIKKQKKGNKYFPHEMSFSYGTDIQTLVKNMMERHPELLNTEADIGIDPKKLPLITKENIAEYLKRSGKGAVCYYRGDDGQTRIMVNTGPGYGKGKNRVLFFPESLKEESPENFKRILHQAIVKHDIEFVYRNLKKQQEKTQETKGKIFSERKSNDKASSAFEHDFKALIKEQGRGTDAMGTARSLVLAMRGGERAKLNSAFQKMNIKNGAELESLLVQWKHEALYPNQTVTAEKKQIRGITLTRV